MPITITVEAQTNTLLVALIGDINMEEFADSKEKLISVRKETRITRVLVDANNRKESLGLMDLLDVSTQISQASMNGMRFAVVSERTQPGLEFARRVTASLQGARMRTFTTEQAARDWLNWPENPAIA